MTDYTAILSNISRYVNLNEAERDAFTAIVHHRSVKRRECIVEPGVVCKAQTYVVSGTLRGFLTDEQGAEHTVQFAIEDWFISDFNSYITQSPASLFVEAIEASVIQQINYADVEALCAKHPVYERFFRLVAQKAFAFAQRRILSNLSNSAEQRYLDFNEQYPSIVQRVPQYALASYLGMTPEFLSKIRKRIAHS